MPYSYFFVLCLTFWTVGATAQETRDVKRSADGSETPLPADSLGFSDPSIRKNFEEWLSRMPSTVAPNPNDILAPVEHDFLSKVALKDEPDFPEINWKDVLSSSHCDADLQYWSKWLERRRKEQQREGGAMTIGADVFSLVGFLVSKLFPRKASSHKTKAQRHRERLEKILEDY